MTTSPSVGPTRLGLLLSESFAYTKAHLQTIVVGALVFGVVVGALQMAFGAKVLGDVSRGMNDMGMDTERMAQLSARMEAGDETALAELEALLEDTFGDMSEDDIARQMMGGGMMTSLLPTIGVGMILGWILSLLAYAYFVLVAVEGKDLSGTLARMQKVTLPLLGVMIWSFLRSFAWIPILGIIPAIILGPRFVAAPLIHLTEGKGVMASVADSYTRTRGYWGKIIGNMIVAGLCGVIAIIVVNMVLGLILGVVPMLLLMTVQIVGQLYMAWLAVFSIRLSHTVLQHPIA